MENKYIVKIKRAAIDCFAGDNVKIVLFGSRARNDNHATSDIDIGIIPDGKNIGKKMGLLKEKVEDLNIPYRIEIVNLSEVSEDFKKQALKDAVIWKG